MELVSTDTLHHRVDGVPTLANAREARALLDTVFAGFVKDETAPPAPPTPTLEVSLAGVKDGNSVLVSLMLVWLRRARHAGVGILFVDTPPLVVNLIEFTGLDEVLPMAAGTAGAAGVIADDVQARVARAIVPSDVTAHGDASRMEIVVVSPAFEGVSRVRKQQLVYAAIAELIGKGALHAVTIRAYTPAEHAAESRSEPQ